MIGYDQAGDRSTRERPKCDMNSLEIYLINSGGTKLAQRNDRACLGLRRR